MAGNRVRLCHVNDLPAGRARGFDPLDEGQDSLFLVRHEGRIYAYRDLCPHQGAAMAWRKHAYLNGDGTRIVCHAHGAQFDITTGKCVLGAALGQSLDPVPLTITDEGELQVQIDTTVA